MVIEYWRYELESRGPLGKGGARSFEGALIRVDGVGHGCLHPWPSLGDADLQEQLRLLHEGQSTPLIEQALHCAQIDGEARATKTSLFEGLPSISNHWQWRFWEDEFTEVSSAQNLGIQLIKIKVSSVEEAEIKLPLVLTFLYGAKVRLDFNGQLPDVETALTWWESLDEEARERVVLIEDPLPSSQDWRRLSEAGMPLALDRTEGESNLPPAAVRVIKPALQRDWPEGIDLLFTSYLDHPLGQCWALWNAGQALKSGRSVLPGGLASHPMFKPNDFSERLKIGDRGILVPPSGTGLGFDDLLARLPWRPLEN